MPIRSSISMDRAIMNTPLGVLEILGSDRGIRSVSFVEGREEVDLEVPQVLRECRDQLQEYFEGRRKEFKLRLDPVGTDFQRRVWQELLGIAYGETTSYKEQSMRLGDLNAIRAVAAANAKNPIAVIIPCHRVVGSDGSLTGYAGGLWRKKWLLELENPPSQTSLF